MYTEVTTNTPLAALTVGQFLEVLENASPKGGAVASEDVAVKRVFPDILSKKQCAELTGYSVWTISRYVCENKIPYFKPAHGGRKVLFRRNEIEGWLLANRHETIEEFKNNFDLKSHGNGNK
ncbi:helix-turn-helix domain-containing protein [uncultured Acetobacteroides sp.]|uniref:helix-turn-helix transcriptional regulator n=1 Tax=uncultured Acetobacteroides sp. TaxID=1760811 RepID=UPI0029F54F78|nr:helix-turn-helix domain-containing protein [uncultured Acetobacteroides sp.]